MYHVLIADDETIVRLMLESMIDWEGLGLLLSGSAANGREAMDILSQEKIDILITDIQMPVVDGLELIQYANQAHRPPQILVLSAYNDFPYVRQAFKLGIHDYCLKRELNAELLTKHLEQMKAALKQSSPAGSGADTAAGEPCKNNKPALLSRLLKGELETEEAGLPEHYFLVSYCVLGYQNIVRAFGKDLDKEFFSSLVKLSRQIAQIAAHGTLVPSGETSLVMIYEAPDPDSLPGLIRVLSRQLKAWKNYMNVDCMAGVSQLARGAADFEPRLAEAAANLTMRYVMKSRRLFSPMDYPSFRPPIPCLSGRETALQSQNAPAQDTALQNQNAPAQGTALQSQNAPAQGTAPLPTYPDMIQALKVHDTARYEKEKAKILARIQSSSLERARQEALNLAYHLAASLIHQLEDTDSIYREDLCDTILRLPSSQEVCIWTINFLGDMNQYMRSHYQFDFPDEIWAALDYIDRNYFKPDLSLSEAASQANFSEKYFSTLFNKRMGMPFSHYLKNLRIHHAKEMLTGTSMKLKEISEAVGYNSVEYFVRVFSAQEGMSPSAYRKKGLPPAHRDISKP